MWLGITNKAKSPRQVKYRDTFRDARTNCDQADDYHNVIRLLQTTGARVVHPVYITPPEEWLVEGGTNVE